VFQAASRDRSAARKAGPRLCGEDGGAIAAVPAGGTVLEQAAATMAAVSKQDCDLTRSNTGV
jgi:hypothetical protein